MKTLSALVLILIMGCAAIPPEINSFDDCVNAGNPVMESYPRQCRTPDGRLFVSEKDRFDIEKSFSCSSDGECILVNEQYGFGCCFGGMCEPIDYSKESWIAVNRIWYDSSSKKYCQPAETCGPAPMCNPMPANDSYSAKCIADQCRKVPDKCAGDSECGAGASCWSRLPAGPSAGVRGSPENPGQCWDDALVSAIVSPAAGNRELCCDECERAYSESPVAAGPNGAWCGRFPSGWDMSAGCEAYFKDEPSTVSQCSRSPEPPENVSFVEGECNALLQSGPMEGKLNIVFVPSHHYTDMAGFANDVPAFRDALLAFPFYANNSEKINFFFLAKTDAEDGCELAGNTTPYCPFDNMRSLASACNYSQSRGDQLVVVFDNDAVSTPYARGESWEDILFIGSGGSGAFVHEFSHSFGDLADTYDGSWNNTAEPESPNCASMSPGYTCADKWGDLMGTGSGDQLVGCYQNCHAENWFRPTMGGDVMRDLSKKFYDPVALRHMEEKMEPYE